MSDRHSAFAPLHGSDAPQATRKASAKPGPTDGMTCVMPVPDDAPAPPASLKGLGTPIRRETYRDPDGRVIGYANRFDRADGTKSFRPLTLWRAADGTLKWVWVGWPDPRPLYGLDRLAARPGAPVIVCEGEKASDAAAQLAPDHATTTSPNGSKSAGKADWSPLRGRHVILWPDADAPGEAYATEAAGLILAAGAASVSRLTPPDGVAAGWDAGDALREGWGPERTAAFLATAQAVARPAPVPVAAAPASAPEKKRGRPAGTGGGDDGERKRGRGRPTWFQILSEITNDFVLWSTPDAIVYAAFEIEGAGRQNWPVQSEHFQRSLLLRAHEWEGETPSDNIPSDQDIKNMVRLLEAKGRTYGEKRKAWRRVGEQNGRYYIDLGDSKWRAIEIAPNAPPRIVERHDLPFVRSACMQPLPEPEFGSEEGINLLRPFVNTEDEAGFMLIACFTAYCLVAAPEFPALILNGEQGTGKSTLTRLLQSIIDPNEIDIIGMPEKPEDLFVAAQHAHLVPIDNLSGIDKNVSDMLCRVATGGSALYRRKYSDAELSVLKALRPLLLNGIPSLAERQDLACRAMTVRLKPIPRTERRTSTDMAKRWQEARPHVFGVLLEAARRGLRDFDAVNLGELPRMAHFVQFMYAAAPALGFDPEEFKAAFDANQTATVENALEEDPVAAAIVTLLERQPTHEWVGTATDLLAALSDPAITPERISRTRSWPAFPKTLSGALKRVAPGLRAKGFFIDDRHSGKTRWTLRLPPPAPDADARSDISHA